MVNSNTPKPGMLSDPWRTPPPVKETSSERDPGSVFAQPKLTRKSAASTDVRAGAAPKDDTTPIQTATLHLTGYGAISVKNADSPTEAAVILLDFLSRNQRETDPILIQYGVLVTQLAEVPTHIKFAIRRPDNWLLAVPSALNRDQGLLQLIQALIQLNAQPLLKKKLESAGISAYRF